jgi:molybdopterin molybdotransferase
MMEIEQLWNLIDQNVSRLGEEIVALASAHGRVLAQDARAIADQPPFDQSAMDGFAISGSGPNFKIIGHQAAGQIGRFRLSSNEAVRVLTGAVIPEGAESVLKQEDCTLQGDFVEANVPILPGAFIRKRGSSRRAGQLVLAAGKRINAGAIGLLAATGFGEVAVTRRPKILHLVTGDELLPPGSALMPGQIHDSNGPMIASLLKERGLYSTEVEQRRLPDSASGIAEAICQFNGNLLLISGGSGPGDRDHTLSSLEQHGFRVNASRINSRPGKPLIFATRDSQVAFGLPGNPLAHFVCYHAFVRRALDQMEGLPPSALLAASLEGPAQDENADGRRTWFPGLLHAVANEGWKVRPLDWKHSGDLAPLAEANALILMDGVNQSECACLPCAQL